MKQNDFKTWTQSMTSGPNGTTTIYQLYKWKKDEILEIKQSCGWCNRQSRIGDISHFYEFFECKECNKKRQENEREIAKKIDKLQGQVVRTENSYFNLRSRTTGLTPVRRQVRMNAGTVYLPSREKKWHDKEEELRILRLDHAKKYFFNESSGYCGWCKQHFSWKSDESKNLGDLGLGRLEKKMRLICKRCYEKHFSNLEFFQSTENFFK
jgi:hypothetical protein